MSPPDIFVDGLLNVTLMKGLVRLDFYSLSATESQKDGQPLPEFRQRVVLTPQALLEVVQSMQVAIRALGEKGVLNLRLPSNDPQIAPPPGVVGHAPQPAAEPIPPVESQEETSAPRPRSRNFPSTMSPSP